jgi:hypothetical protein
MPLLQSKVLLIVLEEVMPADSFELADSCRLIDCIVVLCCVVCGFTARNCILLFLFLLLLLCFSYLLRCVYITLSLWEAA